MKIEQTNKNYNATVVEIKNLIPLEGCDNIQHTNIFGNLVIVSKNVSIGDIGLFFPVETKLSNDYLSYNNLYRDNTKNREQNKKGFFEDNGRIKCVNLRKFPSMGLYMPIESLNYIGDIKLNINDSFNKINNIEICEKYVIKSHSNLYFNKNKKSKKPKVSKIIDGQFHFHYDTEQLGKNVHMIDPNDIITISYKIHGSSFVSSNIKCKRKLNLFEKLLQLIGIKIRDTEYNNIYSSRRVIKNDDINKQNKHYYSEDIWKIVNDKLKDMIPKGWTLYGEIYGYTSDGSYIQKNYDYGCNVGENKFLIYRITITGDDNIIYELPMMEVIRWCKNNGIEHPVLLYSGKAVDLVPSLKDDTHFRENFLETVKQKFNEKNCFICKNSVPEEGVVIRIDGKNGAWKQKSFRFLKKETEDLDDGKIDIESDN